jgi:hypothetical protein
MFAQSMRFRRIILDFSGKKLADRFHQESSHSPQPLLVYLCTPCQEGRFRTIRTGLVKFESRLEGRSSMVESSRSLGKGRW